MNEYRTLSLTSPIPWPVLIPVAALLVYLVVRLYRSERGLVPGRMGKTLTVLRALLPILLLLMLLEPLFSIHWSEALKGRVILLLDGSLSMLATDEHRTDDEKVRLADTLGLLPKGAREVSFREKAAVAAELGRAYPELLEAGKTAGPGSTEKAADTYLEKHEAAFDALESFSDDARKLASAKKRPPEVDKPLQEISTRLKTQVEAHKLIEEALEGPNGIADAAAYDRASGEVITAAAGALLAVQQASDSLLAKSDDKKVREALQQLDAMKRAEVMARLLRTGDAGILNELGAEFHLECYKLTGGDIVEVSPDKLAQSPGKAGFEVDGKKTDVASAVRVAAERVKDGRETSAVVLLSDGQNNAGDDPETAAKILAGSKVPLYTVGIGSGEPPKDIAIAELETSRVVYLGDEVHVGLVVKYDGFQGASAPARIEEDGKTLTEKRVAFPEDRRRTPAELAFVPETVGTHTCVALLPVQDGELIEENNRREFKVDVIDDRIRVLYVEGEPRWEYRFLKNLLMRDKTIELNRLMLEREAPELPRGSEPGRFPELKDDLFRYDVLIIGDLPADRFFPSDLKNIEAFAAENGGAVVVVAGPLFNPASYANTPIEQMLPVRMGRLDPTDEMRRKVQYNGFRPILTHEGEESPITRIMFDKLANATVWEKLPPLHWHAFLNDPKEGAEVLLKAPGTKEDDCVLLATQAYGLGRVLLLATDDSWRWRWGIGDKYFHKFWGQVMRWATAGKSSGRDRYVTMGTQKRRYEVGEPVEFQAKVLDADLHPLRDAQVSAVLERAGKPSEIVSLEFVPESEGRYRTRFQGLESGHYRIRLTVPGLPLNPSEAHVEIDVQDRPDVEQVELFLNQPLLESMSRITGARYFAADDCPRLCQAIQPTKKTVPRVEEIRLWTWPPFLVLFTLVICTEWVLRKKAGLL